MKKHDCFRVFHGSIILENNRRWSRFRRFI